MDRWVSLILIVLMAMGNVFTHAHGDCLCDQEAGVPHFHFGISCTHNIEGLHSHAHDHSHVGTSSANPKDSSTSVENSAKHGSNQPDVKLNGCKDACCSSCDHLVLTPIYMVTTPSTQVDTCNALENCASIFVRYKVFGDRLGRHRSSTIFRSRYTQPIFLQHAALLI